MTEQQLLTELELGKEIKCKYRSHDGVLRYRTSKTAMLEILGKKSVYLVALGGSLIQMKDLEVTNEDE